MLGIRNLSRLVFSAQLGFLFLSPTMAMAQRELTNIPAPDTAAELAAMKLGEDIEVSLFAADPMFAKPIHTNFDAQGRLWVASSSVYPQIAPGEKADDKIYVLEDTDRDGKADKSTIFAEQLLIPTGVLPTLDGRSAYVAASTQLLLLTDVDGDGRADSREIVLSGFGTEDTHHLLHTLRWGPDGWLYMNQSIYIHSHVETPWGTKHLDGGGIWRFHPATKRLEVVSKGLVNPWGHVFDASGQHFATDGAGGEGINYTFPGSVFMTSPGAERWLSGLNPGSPKHCGLEILSGAHVPREFQGHLIANDFRSHRVCRFQLTRTNDGYLSQQQPEVIRTDHVAFRPIDAKIGSDGALYIADWYNPIIQHGEVDFRDDRRDRTHGRIWRVTWKNRPLHAYPYRPDASTPELVRMLDDSLDLTRQWARLQLATRPYDQVRKAVDSWLTSPADESTATLHAGLTAIELRQLEKLRVSEACGHWDQSWFEKLVTDRNPQLRSTALQMASWNLDSWKEPLQVLEKTIHDSDWQVRLMSIVVLRRMGSQAALEVALNTLDHPMNAWSDFALWSFVRESESLWSRSMVEKEVPWRKNLRAMIFVAKSARGPETADFLASNLPSTKWDAKQLAEVIDTIALRADAKSLASTLQYLRQATAQGGLSLADATNVLDRMVDGSAKRNAVPAGADAILKDWMESDAASTDSSHIRFQQSIVSAVGRWSIGSMLPWSIDWLDQHRLDEATVVPAIDGLGTMNDPGIIAKLQQLAGGSESSSTLKAACIRAIAKHDLTLAARLCVAGLADAKATLPGALGIANIASRQGGPEALMAALTERIEISPDAARSAIEALQSASIQRSDLSQTLQKAGRLSDHHWTLTPEFQKELMELVQSHGSPARGELIYRNPALQCSRCHPIGTAGGQIGPNLISLGGSSQLDYIIESVLVPEAKLKEGFQTIIAVTDDGQVVSGLERSRTKDTLSLLTADGKVTDIPRDSISEERTGKSLMPAALADTLSLHQLADLVRFLSELGRTPEYTIGTEPWIRRWDALQYTDRGHVLLNRTSLDSMATDDSVLQWQSVVTRVDGKLPMSELAKHRPHANMKPFAAVRANVSCKKKGVARIEIDVATQFLSWLDGKPIDLIASKGQVELLEGPHQLIVAVHADAADAFGVRIRSNDLRTEELGPEDRAAVIDVGQ